MTKKDKSDKELKEFGYIMALVLLIVTLPLLWKMHPAAHYILGVACVFLLFSIFKPGLLRRIEAAWMYFGTFMGMIMTHVILTIMFLVVISPLGIILRLFGKRFLLLKPDRTTKTYWKEVDQNGSASRHYLPY